MVIRLKFNFKELKQEKPLPYMHAKFFATFFTALITVTINISRDGDGLFYLIIKNIYMSFSSDCSDENLFVLVLKNFASTLIRCLDVALNVIIIFYLIYFIISFIQNRIYSKSSKKHREYLKELLWENIIPNILEINKVEVEFLSNKELLTDYNKRHWKMTMTSLVNLHKNIMCTLNREGVFETISSKNNVSKHYVDYLKKINIVLVYDIFIEQKSTLNDICDMIKDDVRYNDHLYFEYSELSKEYNEIVNMIKTNIVYCLQYIE